MTTARQGVPNPWTKEGHAVITPKRGVVFTHRSFLDKDRLPALMRITSVRMGRVYYTYADDPENHGAFWAYRENWVKRYGEAPNGRRVG